MFGSWSQANVTAGKAGNHAMGTEADTRRKWILPKLYSAGWNDDQISEQRAFTDGRIVVHGTKAVRRAPKRADYLLKVTRDVMLAVVEAKAERKNPATAWNRQRNTRECST